VATKGEIVQAFVEALAPYIGAAMAGASVRGQCDKLGIDGDGVTDAEIEALVEAVTPGLHVFVGADKTAVVIGELRASLARLRRSS
jgi:hypothetical protein